MKTSGDMQPEPFGVERIEVLKGPASVLYGQAPPGGLVNMVTKRPLTKTHHAADIEYGSFDRLQGGVDVGGPVSSKFYYRMTALVRDSETQVDWVPDDRLYIAPAFTWKPTADTTLTWLSYYQHDDIAFVVDVPAQGSLLPNGPYGRVPVHNNLGVPNFDSRINDVYSSGYELEHRAERRAEGAPVAPLHRARRRLQMELPLFRRAHRPEDARHLLHQVALHRRAVHRRQQRGADLGGKGQAHLPARRRLSLGEPRRFLSEADAGTIDIYRPVYSHKLGSFFHWEDFGEHAVADRLLCAGAGKVRRASDGAARRPQGSRRRQERLYRLQHRRADPQRLGADRRGVHLARRPRLSLQQWACALFLLFAGLRAGARRYSPQHPLRADHRRAVRGRHQVPAEGQTKLCHAVDLRHHADECADARPASTRTNRSRPGK